MDNKRVKQIIEMLIPKFNHSVTCCWWSCGVLVAQVRVCDDEFEFDDVRFRQGVASLTADQLKGK